MKKRILLVMTVALVMAAMMVAMAMPAFADSQPQSAQLGIKKWPPPFRGSLDSGQLDLQWRRPLWDAVDGG